MCRTELKRTCASAKGGMLSHAIASLGKLTNVAIPIKFSVSGHSAGTEASSSCRQVFQRDSEPDGIDSMSKILDSWSGRAHQPQQRGPSAYGNK
jgi:hypothetical protein